MKHIQRKLHSRRGASMVLAVLFLLVCLMVGAVVLTAAATTSGRLARNRQEQQDYLAVASAARLVEEDLRAASFSAAYDRVETEYSETSTDADGNSSTTYWTEITYRAGPTPAVQDNVLLDPVTSDLAALYYTALSKNSTVWNGDWESPRPSTLPDVQKLEYALAFPADGDKGIPAVTGTLTIAKGPELDPASQTSRYNVTVLLSTEEGGNTMTLTFSAFEKERRAVTQRGNPVVTTYTTTVTWDAPVITKGAAS